MDYPNIYGEHAYAYHQNHTPYRAEEFLAPGPGFSCPKRGYVLEKHFQVKRNLLTVSCKVLRSTYVAPTSSCDIDVECNIVSEVENVPKDWKIPGEED